MSHPASAPRRHLSHSGTGTPPAGWRQPTFREFAERIEREFGVIAGPSGHTARERLTPADIRGLCRELGLPPEDLGV
jgi:hypothetical protein